jgi:Heterokaryon incompatibility protein (HET)
MGQSLTYEPLVSSKSEIRLLKLRSSNNGGFQCELTKCSLNDNPEYYALSYVWGDSTVTKNILVNGKTFAATTNLIAALEILSVELHNSDLLWIDAICINQRDIAEKNAQVQMMSSIFKKALAVVAWVGPEQGDSTEVIEIMNHLAAEIRSSKNAGVEILSRPAPQQLLDRLNPETSDMSLLSLILPREQGFVRLLSERLFWKRAWILQELVLAKEVLFVCGRRANFGYSVLKEIGLWLNSLPSAAKPADVDWVTWSAFRFMVWGSFKVQMKIWSLAVTSDDTLSSDKAYSRAWKIFEFASLLAAADPRDKVYSLLGLMSIGIEADYSKAPEMIYREVAAIMFRRVPLDEWFQKTGIGFGDRMSTLPTWVVDWNALCKEGLGSFTEAVGGDAYNADSGMPDLSARTKIDGDILTIFGTIYDEIEILAPFPGEIGSNAREAFKFDLTGGLPNQGVLHTMIPPGIPRGQASLRLCLDDKDLIEKRRFVINSSFFGLAQFYLVMLQLGEGPQGLAFTYESDSDGWTKIFLGENISPRTLELVREAEIQDNHRPYQAALVTRFPCHFGNARHFYTRKGSLGYGPKGLQKGDLVCVLPGCRVPVILRKAGDFYHHVSTGLVLGLMDGEAAQMLEKGELVMQQFDIL